MNLRNLLKSGGLAALIVGILAMGTLLAYGVTEEVPIGSLEGDVTMLENAKALPNADVIIRAQFETPETVRKSRFTKTDAAGNFTFRNIPAGTYVMEVYGKAHRATQEGIVVRQGEVAEVRVSTLLSGPDLSLTAANRVYLPNETPSLQINGVSQDPNVVIDVFRVKADALAKERSLDSLFSGIVYNRNKQNPETMAALEPVQRKEQPIQMRDVEGVFVETLTLPGMSEGIYLMRATVGKMSAYAWLTVTRLGLVTKQAGANVLAYCVDLASGKPVSGARLSVYGSAGPQAMGVSDANGVVTYRRTSANDDRLMVAAESGGSRAYSWFYASDSRGGRDAVWTQTDRPIYRPGDTVQFKGVLRTDDDGTYRLPKATTVTARFYDPDETLMKETRLAVSPVGTVHGEFAIDKVSMPGSYRLSIDLAGEEFDRYISISAYRKPEVKITVAPESPFYTRGERVRMKVKAETFTGEPVVGADVDAVIFRQSVWSGSPFEDESFYNSSDEDYGYDGEYIDEAQTRTDELGEAVVVIDTRSYKSKDFDYSDSIYTVRANISDAGGRYFEGKGSVRVGRGLFDLRAEFDRYVSGPGEDLTLSLSALMNADGKPATGQAVTVEYGRERYGKTGATFIPEGKRSIKLDEKGEAKLTIRPQSAGSFIAKVSSSDSKGNLIKSEGYLYVYGGADTDLGEVPQIQIVLDKKNYAPADTATALIRTSLPGGSALVTIEADKVMWSRVVPLTQTATAVKIDGLADYAPNAFVSVSYIRDKQYFSAEKSLNVDLKAKRLQVAVVANTEECAPGDDVEYTITTTTEDGKPVQADVALGVVDEGIYQLREDTNDPLRYFYPRRWSNVQTSYSFPTIYLDGDDKAPVDMEIRRNFEDTAFWRPDILTDQSGRATVTVRLPDNLTAWRATATAITSATAIGKGRTQVVAKKDLMARMSLPPFLTQDDDQAVTAMISNTTDRPLTVKARLDASGVQTAGDVTKPVEIPARSSRSVAWNVKAGRPGQARFTLAAWVDGGPNDGLQLSIPIQPRGRTVREVHAASLSKTGSVIVDKAADAQKADLKISIAPTLAASLLESLPYLIDYPYGCVEQTLSRFVPAVVVDKFLRDTNYPMPEIQAKIPEITKQGLVRLRMMQQPSGGWGWWEYDEGSAQMTAKVLDGLYRARQSGVSVNEQMIERALEWSKKTLATPDARDRDAWFFEGRLALAAAVLQYESDQAALGYLKAASTRDKLSVGDLATLTSAWHRRNLIASGPEKAEALRYRDRLYRQLLAAATVGESTIIWPGDYYDDTAKALEAVVLVEPNSGKVEKILRYLLAKKKGNAWYSTQDTAQIILATAEYLRSTNELAPAYSLDVVVNGTSVRQVEAKAFMAGLTLVVPGDHLLDGKNSVEFRMTGTGQLYYSVDLTQNVYETEMPARQTSSDFTVRREYFRMQAQRLEDGTMKLLPSKRTSDSFRSGEVFRVRLTLSAKKALNYVAIEDPIPSNCRIVDVDTPFDGYEWMNWWARSVFLDDRAAFFVTYLGSGNHVIEYAVRAEAPGVCSAMPTTAYPMYQPETQAWSAAQRLTVTK